MASMTFKIKKLDIQNRFRSGIWKCYSKPSETNKQLGGGNLCFLQNFPWYDQQEGEHWDEKHI